MSEPFKGVINTDIRDSTPDWEPYIPRRRLRGRRTS
jgi:arylsulfatase